MSNYSNSLFVGDLPKFCNEADLEQVFIPFGPLVDVKIKRNNNTGKTLSYGFVTFPTLEAADIARVRLDGYMMMGRKLKVRWAAYNAKSQQPTPESIINSVYVRFVTPRLDQLITEVDLHRVFDAFNHVDDVSIKESSIDHRSNRQCGYGFVHFAANSDGIESAFQAVSKVDNATIDGVTYNVELSRNLLKQFNAEGRSRSGSGSHGSSSPVPSAAAAPGGYSTSPVPGPPTSLSYSTSMDYTQPPVVPQHQQFLRRISSGSLSDGEDRGGGAGYVVQPPPSSPMSMPMGMGYEGYGAPVGSPYGQRYPPPPGPSRGGSSPYRGAPYANQPMAPMPPMQGQGQGSMGYSHYAPPPQQMQQQMQGPGQGYPPQVVYQQLHQAAHQLHQVSSQMHRPQSDPRMQPQPSQLQGYGSRSSMGSIGSMGSMGSMVPPQQQHPSTPPLHTNSLSRGSSAGSASGYRLPGSLQALSGSVGSMTNGTTMSSQSPGQSAASSGIALMASYPAYQEDSSDDEADVQQKDLLRADSMSQYDLFASFDTEMVRASRPGHAQGPPQGYPQGPQGHAQGLPQGHPGHGHHGYQQQAQQQYAYPQHVPMQMPYQQEPDPAWTPRCLGGIAEVYDMPVIQQPTSAGSSSHSLRGSMTPISPISPNGHEDLTQSLQQMSFTRDA